MLFHPYCLWKSWILLLLHILGQISLGPVSMLVKILCLNVILFKVLTKIRCPPNSKIKNLWENDVSFNNYLQQFYVCFHKIKLNVEQLHVVYLAANSQAYVQNVLGVWIVWKYFRKQEKLSCTTSFFLYYICLKNTNKILQNWGFFGKQTK